MSPKSRNAENKGLPKRWRLKNGAYYYRVPEGLEYLWEGKKEFRLGKSLSEAYRSYAQRVDSNDDIVNMGKLCEKYSLEVIPTKAPATQKSNNLSIARILKAFNDNPISLIRPVHIYKYRDFIGKTESKKYANLDLEVLSHMFTKAIQWGLIDVHPMTNKKVVKFTLEPRSRYVKDWELGCFLSVSPIIILLYCRLRGLTGLDKGDMLSIPTKGIEAHRLVVPPRKKNISKNKGKVKRDRYFPYVDEKTGESTGIKEVIDEIMALPNRPDITTHLFCTTSGKNRGRPYIKEDGTTSGFDSMWYRTMKKALEKTDLKKSFTDHDLRAKVSSDIETDEGARQQMDHSTIAMTRSTYRRKEVKMPVAKGFKTDEQ